MRIALLADIHGNLTALKVVLKDIKSHDIDRIIIAGDLVGDGPFPHQVINEIKKLNACVIKGNRDNDMLKYDKGELNEWNNYKQMSAMVWTYHQTKDNLDYIKGLSDNLIVRLDEEDSIKVVHGSPRDIYEHLYHDKMLDRLDQAITLINENILICGHTHIQWDKEYKGVYIANPGSLGMHFNKQKAAEYSILFKKNNKWNVENRYVQYDINELENSYHTSGMYDYAPVWSSLALHSLRSGENQMIKFIQHARNTAENNGYINYRLIPDKVWDEAFHSWMADKAKV